MFPENYLRNIGPRNNAEIGRGKPSAGAESKKLGVGVGIGRIW
jgi:hypothetical protein